MNNTILIDNIRDLIPSLPDGDRKLAYGFLDNRDFESLHLLVKSSITRVRKGLKKEKPRQEYLNADIAEMRKLKSEVDAYYSLLM